MGIEVELKAHVDDPDGLSRELHRLGSFQRRYDKRDRYFGYPDNPARTLFRLRRDDGAWLCTFKKRRIKNLTEENEETEFEVSDDEAFRRFAGELGFEVVVEKRKVGAMWLVDGVTVELSEVNDLGYFLELELILSDGSDEEEAENARNRLFSLLHRFGISETALEDRPYTQIIYENAITHR